MEHKEIGVNIPVTVNYKNGYRHGYNVGPAGNSNWVSDREARAIHDFVAKEVRPEKVDPETQPCVQDDKDLIWRLLGLLERVVLQQERNKNG